MLNKILTDWVGELECETRWICFQITVVLATPCYFPRFHTSRHEMGLSTQKNDFNAIDILKRKHYGIPSMLWGQRKFAAQ